MLNRMGLSQFILLLLLMGCAVKAPYSGQVVDALGRPVPHATVIGRRDVKGPGEEMISIGGPADSDGKFDIATSVKLQEIMASSPDGKRHGVVLDPARTGSVIVIR